METIQRELAEHIAGILSVTPDAVDVEAPLHSLGLDSMRMVEIIVFIETHYGIDLMGSALKRDEVASIAALARTVEKRKKL